MTIREPQCDYHYLHSHGDCFGELEKCKEVGGKYAPENMECHNYTCQSKQHKEDHFLNYHWSINVNDYLQIKHNEENDPDSIEPKTIICPHIINVMELIQEKVYADPKFSKWKDTSFDWPFDEYYIDCKNKDHYGENYRNDKTTSRIWLNQLLLYFKGYQDGKSFSSSIE